MHIFKNTNFDFLSWRWHAIILSWVVIIAGGFVIFTKGIPLGVEFAGGTSVIARFDTEPAIDADGSDSVPQGAGALADPSIPFSFACSVPRWGRSPAATRSRSLRPWRMTSSTPVAFTVCGTFQLSAVNVSVVRTRAPSVTSSLLSGIDTSAAG